MLAAVGEAVLFGDPQVQGVEQGLDGFRFVGEALLDHRRQGGQQDGGVDAFLVEDLQVGGAAVELGAGLDRGAAIFPEGQALGVLAPVPALVGTHLGHHLEGGVGDVVGDHTRHRELGAAVDLHVLEIPLEGLGQMAQEGFRRLVVMLVRIVDGVVGGRAHQ